MEIIKVVSLWLIPAIICFIPLYAWYKGLNIYDEFIVGAKEGIMVVWNILPFLVGIIAAIKVFTVGGGMDLLYKLVSPFTEMIGIPSEVVPLALLRPLSGSGSLGLTSTILSDYGADSFIGRLASVMQGSTETTLYVLAIYFGAVGIKKYRYSLWAGLIGDFTAFLAAFFFCSIYFR